MLTSRPDVSAAIADAGGTERRLSDWLRDAA